MELETDVKNSELCNSSQFITEMFAESSKNLIGQKLDKKFPSKLVNVFLIVKVE